MSSFAPVTTYNRPKAFAFSYSKLKNWRTCPKRFFHIDHKKDVKEPEGPELKWGNELHKAFAEHVAKGTPLPDTMVQYQGILDRIKAFPGETFVEMQYCITKDFAPTEWKDWSGGWYRGIGDVVKIYNEFAYVGDYKTGKVTEDSEQLGLLAQCLFAHYPQLQAVRAEFIWLKEDAVTRATFRREEMPRFWAEIMPSIKGLQRAIETDDFPARPSGLCGRYCPVLQCGHNGRNNK
jgi:hypothetical protein